MKPSLLLIIFFLCIERFMSWGQYQNVWTFGKYAGLDFNTTDSRGFPTPIKSKSYTLEGTATICDTNGNLLFYTDGVCVYNRQHQMMSNAPLNNLKNWLPANYESDGAHASTRSSSQTCIIIQYPGKEYLYYLFSLTGETGGVPNDAEGRLYYSLIDMRLNNGMGDIVDTCNGMYLGNGYSEAITSILGLEKIWLIVPRKRTLSEDVQNHSILAFSITNQGFHNQPVESILNNSTIFIGAIVPNNQGSQLAYSFRSRFVSGTQEQLYLLNFNRRNGEVSSILELEKDVYVYGLAFSPNDKILYNNTGTQYNLETQERYVWRPGLYSWLSHLKLGSDKRIYFNNGVRSLGVISNPNVFGSAVDASQSISLEQATNAAHGLPNVYNSINYKIQKHQFCLNKGDTLWPQTDLNFFDVVWNDTLEADYFIPDQNGIYKAKYLAYGVVYIDSFKIEFRNDYELSVTHKNLACTENSDNLVYISTNDNATYITHWLDSRNNILHTGDTVPHLPPGEYIINFKQNLCEVNLPLTIHRKSYQVQMELTPNCNQHNNGKAVLNILNDDVNRFESIWLNADYDTLARNVDTLNNLANGAYGLYLSSVNCDTFISFSIQSLHLKAQFDVDSFWCINQKYDLINTSDTQLNYFQWQIDDSFISTQKHFQYTPDKNGFLNIKLIATHELCVDSISKNVWIDTLQNSMFQTERDSICVGEVIILSSISDASIISQQWYFDKKNFTHTGNSVIQHAFDYPGIKTITLKTKYRVCPETAYQRTVWVFENPEVYLGSDSSLCNQSKAIVLQNLITPPTNTNYLWSTGDTSRSILIKSPGLYSLTQRSEPIGCTGYGSIEISKDCFVDIPNAFTPNGDGVNDYFFPRKWLSNGVVNFHLQIFNRWGQLIYETTNIEGLGWDGKMNGTLQPMGVYVYRISVTFKNGKQEDYEGNVTLMR